MVYILFPRYAKVPPRILRGFLPTFSKGISPVQIKSIACGFTLQGIDLCFEHLFFSGRREFSSEVGGPLLRSREAVGVHCLLEAIALRLEAIATIGLLSRP